MGVRRKEDAMYGWKKERKENRFAGRIRVLLLWAALAAFSGCGRGKAAVLETLPAEAAEKNEGAEASDLESGTETAAETETVRETVKETVLQEALQVHVCGAVKAPGVYGLPAGSRVFEAVEAAGGVTADGAGDYLNLADEVFDGAKVRVPFLSELSEGEACGPSGAFGVTGSRTDTGFGADEGTAGVKDGLVDLNHADREALMSLPGIGEAKAEAILSWREEQGLFEKPEDIMQIPGIKEAAYEKLKDKITVKN